MEAVPQLRQGLNPKQLPAGGATAVQGEWARVAGTGGSARSDERGAGFSRATRQPIGGASACRAPAPIERGYVALHGGVDSDDRTVVSRIVRTGDSS
jgi:hypothetical protein